MKLNLKEIFKIFILSIGIFLFVLDLFIINVSLPSIQHSLQLSNSKTQWIIILYIIGYASLLISAGNAGATFGRKKLYLIGMIGFTLASLICGISSNIYMLLGGRLLQGISSGLMVPQGISLITILFENQQKKTMALGIYGSFAGLASVLGQFLGGILPDQNWIAESWRLIFLVNIPIGILAIIMTLYLIPKDIVNHKQKILFKEMIQVFLLLIFLIYPLIVGPELQWPWWNIVLLIISIGLLILFIKKQKTLFLQQSPTFIDFSLFQNKVFNLGLFAALAYYMVQDAYFIINSNYLQNFREFTPTMTGIAFVYQGIGYVFASVIASRLVDKIGRLVVLIGLSIMIIGLGAHLIIFDQPEINVNQIHFLFFFYGLGCGTVLPSLMTLALRNLDQSLIGVGSALYLTVQQLSICLGIAFIVGFYLNHSDQLFLNFSQISSAYGYSTLASIILLFIVGYVINRLFTTTKSN
ncbi:MFS transporter [Empedobacter falsenii]|uniref:MFS transporter n=1 Tax=Empedobacter falsenii TaxID=343874 RepID=UPI0025756A64|nr:MFS transporter [Empedobacter falsenii]MDM1547211.1 MFS transporter [Empedobacter falsenii]